MEDSKEVIVYQATDFFPSNQTDYFTGLDQRERQTLCLKTLWLLFSPPCLSAASKVTHSRTELALAPGP